MKKTFINLLQIAITVYLLYAGIIYIRVFVSARNLPEFQNQEFLHFIIYGSSTSDEGNTVSARFTIVDSSGNSISEIERSWNGNYLAVKFNQAKILNKYFIFPEKIYAKDRIIESGISKNKGTHLERYYSENRECILPGKKSLKKNRENLYIISRFTNKKYYVPTFTIVDSYVLDLSNCDSDVFYTISCDKNGKLTLLQM